MASFSSLFTSLTGAGFFYQKNSRHATHVYNQDGQALYNNQPRFPFEYYVAINLDMDAKLATGGTARGYVNSFLNSVQLTQVPPLIKSIDMPAMKIETEPLNQYNRKRLSQSKISFEPIKMVFHDVADGKTLKFWDMYYRYYFQDGIEPRSNSPVNSQADNKPYNVESLIRNLTPQINPALSSLPSSIRNVFSPPSNAPSRPPTNDVGEKNKLQNIITDTLDNHKFGYNINQVRNIRNLVQSIVIYQVHGGRFNRVTLVNPRVASFSHDTLNYSISDRTLELTFTFEYEYAYYDIENLKLGEKGSSTEPFERGEFLELPALSFNAAINNFLETNNPLLQSDNPILQRIGKNVQTSIGGVTGSFLGEGVRRVTSGALDGLANITPKPVRTPNVPAPVARPFSSTARTTTTMYPDVNRRGNA